MKICLLADANDIHTQKWASFFVKKNHTVHLISFLEAEIPGVNFHKIKRLVPVSIGPNVSSFGKLGYFYYPFYIRKLIWKISPDLLHAHWASSYGFMGACSGYHPFVLSTWGTDVIDFPNQSFIHKKILEFSLSKAEQITATSHMLSRETYKYVSPGKPVLTIPFGVDINMFKPKAECKKDLITIGIVKKLEKKYGIEFLIEAFSGVVKKHPNLKLQIIGKGSEENKLKIKVAGLGLKKQIDFLGFIPNYKIPVYLNRMDIFVVPSIKPSETFGVAAVEAAACEIPVIASDVGGLPEVVLDGKTGFLVPPCDSDAIAEKILILIENEKQRKKMGKAARKFVEVTYNWENNASQMEALYYSIINKP